MKIKQILFLIIFIILFLALPFIVADKQVELEEIKNTITPFVTSKDLKEQQLNTIYKNYNISKSLISDFVSYSPLSYMDVEEITIIKQESQEKRELIKNKMEKYINKKIPTFESYGPKQVELLKNCVINIKGNYIYLIVSENSQEVKEAIDKLF